MNKKIILIIPYFGKFNSYFELWLKSIEYNKEIDFLLITDNKEKYNYPLNLKVVYQEFNDVKNRIKKIFGGKCKIKTPYKLCDYKPFYNIIFSQYVKGYDFWGYCDNDLIFGNISKFITDDLLNKYDKIYTFGHLTLYKNSDDITEIIKTEKISTDYYTYKEMIRTDYICHFDEYGGISKIFNQYYPTKQYESIDDFADINCDSYSFKINGSKYDKVIFKWENGRLFSMYLDNDEIKNKEYLYIHLQKRDMNVVCEDISNINNMLIVPNKFIINKYDITNEFLFNNTQYRKYKEFRKKRISYIIFNIKNDALKQRIYRKYKKAKCRKGY